jgi:hypothetical protein
MGWSGSDDPRRQQGVDVTNEIDDTEIMAAVRLMEELCTAAGEQVVCYDWNESGTLALVDPVNPQKEAT